MGKTTVFVWNHMIKTIGFVWNHMSKTTGFVWNHMSKTTGIVWNHMSKFWNASIYWLVILKINKKQQRLFHNLCPLIQLKNKNLYYLQSSVISIHYFV